MEIEFVDVTSRGSVHQNIHHDTGVEQDSRPVSSKTIYEQPLNERIRTFLRLDFLFRQGRYHLVGDSVWDSRAAISSLIEILDIFGRSDLKAELIKELERHILKLGRLQENPDVDSGRLNGLLDELDVLVDRLHATEGQLGIHLRQNEFLGGVGQRAAIPGGTCDFDVPAYHYWLQRPGEERNRDLATWFSGFDTVSQSIRLVLQLTRESNVPESQMAQNGLFQKSLDPAMPCQLVRVALPADSGLFAVISGGRHRLSIRFLEQSGADGRAAQTQRDVDFELSCCIT